jgi:signal transduction histidine kinase
MKHFRKIMFGLLMFWLFLAFFSSYLLYQEGYKQQSKGFKVDINRINYELSQGSSLNQIDLSQYNYVREIRSILLPCTSNDLNEFFSGADIPKGLSYSVLPLFEEETVIGYMSFLYESNHISDIHNIIIYYNIFLAIIVLSLLIILEYVRQSVLKPFHEIVDIPYELSKGHLVTEIKENKSRFFGKFLWGLDLLRKNLEDHKKRELQLEKEKKTMILSISHDIKTPVSTIKLYAKALYENLYNSEEKRIDVAKGIEEKANQIEGFVNEIIAASTNDILDIPVNSGEFYLSDLVNKLHKTYDDKLKLLMFDFKIDSYDNILLKGDLERSIEVLENIVENAIKYGDGKNIEITFADEDYCKLITVTNSGIPLPETEFVHMFESFWRGSNAHERPGNGLGLYICKEIMKKMDGDIFVHSTINSMGVTLVIRYSE